MRKGETDGTWSAGMITQRTWKMDTIQQWHIIH